MENCKDLDKLFGENCIIVDNKDNISLTKYSDKDHYSFDGEQLIYEDSYSKRLSNIKYIFAYHEGVFSCLYEKPIVRPDIQTGDFIRVTNNDVGVVVGDYVYYEDGGFDRLYSIAKLDSYIVEIRQPSETAHGFSGYDKMPVIWVKK